MSKENNIIDLNKFIEEVKDKLYSKSAKSETEIIEERIRESFKNMLIK